MSEFRFKHFTVDMEGAAMKVGTDGVLVGAWAALDGARRILDIGSGTGVIALMAAQRNADADIVAIDVDKAATECAARNFERSPWAERLSAKCVRVQDFADDERFDAIISNPPYFLDSLLSPSQQRTMARHAVTLTFEELSDSVCRLLSDDGHFTLILPTEEMAIFEAITPLSISRYCNVYSIEGGSVKRVMAEFRRRKTTLPKVEELTIELPVRGQFTAEYRQLTKDFYLKF